jgi:hypothetical protein
MKRKFSLSRRPGSVGLQDCAIVLLQVRSAFGDLTPLLFCIDTGADYSALPIPLACREGIAFPRDEARRSIASGLVGSVAKYRGVLRVRIFSEDFVWPCDFLDTSGPASAIPYGVIGRAGFLDAFALCVEKPLFTLRRRGSFWKRLLPPWTPTHNIDQPL